MLHVQSLKLRNTLTFHKALFQAQMQIASLKQLVRQKTKTTLRLKAQMPKKAKATDANVSPALLKHEDTITKGARIHATMFDMWIDDRNLKLQVRPPIDPNSSLRYQSEIASKQAATAEVFDACADLPREGIINASPWFVARVSSPNYQITVSNETSALTVQNS